VWDLRTAAQSVALAGAGRAVAFDRASERVAVAGEELAVVSTDGQVEYDVVGRPHAVTSVAWSPDGRRLAGGMSGSAALWTSLERAPRTLDTAGGVVDRIVWSPGGDRIATVATGQVEMWNSNGRRLARVPGSGEVMALAFTPDGSRVMVARQDGAIDVLTGAGRHFRCADTDKDVSAAIFSADGRYLVSGENVPERPRAPEVRRVRIARKCSSRLIGLSDGVTITSVMTDEHARVIYAAADDQTVRIWDIEAYAQLATLTDFGAHTRLVLRHSESDGSDVLVSASADGMIRLWRPATVPVARFDARERVQAVTFDDSGDKVLAATAGGVRGVPWRSATTMRREGPRIGRTARSVFSRDGARLAVGSAREVRIRDLAGGRSLRMPSPAVASLDFNPDGSRLLTMHSDGVARIWRTDGRADAEELPQSEPGTGRPYAFFSDRGRRAVVVAADTREYDLGSEQPRDAVNAAAPDTARLGAPPAAAHGGRLVVSSDSDGVWIGPSGDLDRRLPLRVRAAVSAMAFSPDGNVIATASRDGLRLWDAWRGEPLASLAVGRFDSVAFSQDGHRLVASTGRTVLVFDCRPCGTPKQLRDVAEDRDAGTATVVLQALPDPVRGLREYRFKRSAAETETETEPERGPVRKITPQTLPTPLAKGGDPQSGGGGSSGGGGAGGGGGGSGGEDGQQQPVPEATPQPEPTAAPTVAPTEPAPTPTPESGSEAVGGDGDGVG
jgi:WD40 repeat protein